jgi:hypothetical protein
VVDIFTALLGLLSIGAFGAAISKILLSEPKVWNEEHWESLETKEAPDYNELRKSNPHIWME